MKRIATSLRRVSRLAAYLYAGIFVASPVHAKEIFVAKDGTDANLGSAKRPVLTIQRAAELARPGDTVTVRSGVYREWVKPPRGGTSNARRITFRAAPGEDVKIVGSEQVVNWTKAGHYWQAVLPASFFGDFNPFAELIKYPGSGKEDTDRGWGWLRYGRWTHRGDVYFNGEGFSEVETEAGLARPKTWRAEVDSQGATLITANFSDQDPNAGWVEVNVRPALFYPGKTDVNYITLRGFTFMNAAPYWAPPFPNQLAAVGPNGGHHWTIEDNAILYAKATCLSIGTPSETGDESRSGHHVIRGNVFMRCGQAGVLGKRWHQGSSITGNVFEDINYRYEFGGAETGAIKLHYARDVRIERNLIDGVGSIDPNHSNGDGIWLDVGATNVAIRSNVLSRVDANTMLMEANYEGPVLIENNIVLGGDVSVFSSKNVVWSNNLFVNARKFWVNQSELGRPPIANIVWTRNVYVGIGDTGRRLPADAGSNDRSIGNLYLGGARPGANEVDAVALTANPQFKMERMGTALTIQLTMDEAASAATQHEPAARTDFFGNPRARGSFAHGPFADLKPGANTISVFNYPPQYNRALAALKCGVQCPQG